MKNIILLVAFVFLLSACNHDEQPKKIPHFQKWITQCIEGHKWLFVWVDHKEKTVPPVVRQMMQEKNSNVVPVTCVVEPEKVKKK